jgi:hypothetical protein
MTQTVPDRETKRADQLAAGDWLAAGPYITQPGGTDDAEVLFVHSYVSASRSAVAVTIQEVGIAEPMTIHLQADAEITLLTAAELAAQRAEADRRRIADGMRALAGLIVRMPVTLPEAVGINVALPTRADVRAVAEALGVSTGPWIKTGLQAVWPEGRKTYDAGFHLLAYTSEPGTTCEELADPDPTGLAYSRPADDPTPVSPAREPLHTGGVVDGGRLVDETPAPVELLAIVPTADGVVTTTAPVGAVVDPVRRAHVVELTEAVAEHYDATGWETRASGSASCACGETFPGLKALVAHLAETPASPEVLAAADVVPVPAEDATLTRNPE